MTRTRSGTGEQATLVARALVRAIDAAAEEDGTARNDPAVQMIIDHLCFLCGLPQPSLDMDPISWGVIEEAVQAQIEKEST